MIQIKNWEHFQHYKNRKPPWIKLYRELLDDHDWQFLSDYAARLLMQLWLIASENNTGEIDQTNTQLMWRLRVAPQSAEKFNNALQELADAGFILSASNVLADCGQDATPETETETEKRRAKRSPIRAEYTSDFEEFWKAYPRRIGKRKAYTAYKQSLKLADAATILAGAERYAKAMRSTEAQYIAHPTTWLNRGGWDDELGPMKPSNGGWGKVAQ